jgi:hypothetical protein
MKWKGSSVYFERCKSVYLRFYLNKECRKLYNHKIHSLNNVWPMFCSISSLCLHMVDLYPRRWSEFFLKLSPCEKDMIPLFEDFLLFYTNNWFAPFSLDKHTENTMGASHWSLSSYLLEMMKEFANLLSCRTYVYIS